MINSNVFNYINVLDKAADASWLRNEAIANNIANVDTPGYKRQDITFEKELERALANPGYNNMDDKVAYLNEKNSRRLEARTYTDYEGYSYRLDGNNVDIDTENTMLASNQIKYNGLIASINQEFTNLKMVMK
jgi:flagellar basal-body rod protein FlgB